MYNIIYACVLLVIFVWVVAYSQRERERERERGGGGEGRGGGGGVYYILFYIGSSGSRPICIIYPL